VGLELTIGMKGGGGRGQFPHKFGLKRGNSQANSGKTLGIFGPHMNLPHTPMEQCRSGLRCCGGEGGGCGKVKLLGFWV